MTDNPTQPQSGAAGTDPFGMSRFSPRRYTIRHLILLFLTIGLLAALLVHSAIQGNAAAAALSATGLAMALSQAALGIWAGKRTVEVEAWIRRLGAGDLEHRIEPRGDDEISMACRALETLRLRCIEVVRLQLVENLSADLESANADLEARNEELNRAMAELRTTQSRLVAQQKLQEMVVLTTGVAHEIRNPLNIIASFSEIASGIAAEIAETLEAGRMDQEGIRELSADLQSGMRAIRRNVERADLVVARMTGIGAANEARHETGVNAMARQALQTAVAARRDAGEANAPAPEFQPDPGDPRCAIALQAVSQAIASLYQNACDATADNENAAVITLSVQSDRDEVRITVEDDGCGMTPEVLSQAMTPFFTTKKGDRQGAGLSLFQAAEVARAHGGDLTLESTEGRGTRATMSLKSQPAQPTAAP